MSLVALGSGSVELGASRAAILDVTRIGLKIELILGVNAFTKHRLQFDFKEGRVYILQ